MKNDPVLSKALEKCKNVTRKGQGQKVGERLFWGRQEKAGENLCLGLL